MRSSSRSDRGACTRARARSTTPGVGAAAHHAAAPRRARGARLALVSALASLGVARGERSASWSAPVGPDPTRRRARPPPARTRVPCLPSDRGGHGVRVARVEGQRVHRRGRLVVRRDGSRDRDPSIVTGRNRGVSRRTAGGGRRRFGQGAPGRGVDRRASARARSSTRWQVDPEWAPRCCSSAIEPGTVRSAPFPDGARRRIRRSSGGHGRCPRDRFPRDRRRSRDGAHNDAVAAERDVRGAYHDAMVRKDRCVSRVRR